MIRNPTLLWTEQDNNYLRKYYTIKTGKEIAETLDRTESAIASHARDIGLPRKIPIWTDEETKYLLDNYAKKTSKELGRILNKTVRQIWARIGKIRRYSNPEMEI